MSITRGEYAVAYALEARGENERLRTEVDELKERVGRLERLLKVQQPQPAATKTPKKKKPTKTSKKKKT
jgi:regulator of replication initiation timing